MPEAGSARHELRASAAWTIQLRQSRNCAPAFAIGFCILFAFIGTFTYVNFVLVRAAPVASAPWHLGVVYFVFLPADGDHDRSRAGCAVQRQRHAGPRSCGRARCSPPSACLGSSSRRAFRPFIVGMVLIGVGTFFAQACATGFVGQAARDNRGIASGTYLACYFFGGLVGSAVLGQLFDRFGWTACVAGVGASLAIAALLTVRLTLTQPPPSSRNSDYSAASGMTSICSWRMTPESGSNSPTQGFFSSTTLVWR